MLLTTCTDCGIRVVLTAEGDCPACRTRVPTDPEANGTRGNKEAGPAGIRGWLILPAIGLIVSAVLGPIGLLAAFGSIGVAMDPRYVDETYAMYALAYATLYFLVNLGLYLYLTVTLVRFFRKWKEAPISVTRLLIAKVIASMLLFVLGLPLIGMYGEVAMLALIKSNNFIAALLAAGIWIPYFQLSKRVKATFVN